MSHDEDRLASFIAGSTVIAGLLIAVMLALVAFVKQPEDCK
jgi:hypothetical protein